MNILGFGLDLVEVERFGTLLKKRGAAFEKRVFTTGEIKYCRARRHPAEHFAARWAAKEAFFKALGTGWGTGGAFRDIEVVHAEGGAPTLRAGGKALALLDTARIVKMHLTLTHTDCSAAAAVILIAENERHW